MAHHRKSSCFLIVVCLTVSACCPSHQHFPTSIQLIAPAQARRTHVIPRHRNHPETIVLEHKGSSPSPIGTGQRFQELDAGLLYMQRTVEQLEDRTGVKTALPQ